MQIKAKIYIVHHYFEHKCQNFRWNGNKIGFNGYIFFIFIMGFKAINQCILYYFILFISTGWPKKEIYKIGQFGIMGMGNSS